MKFKYFTQRYKQYFIFGKNEEKGLVDISDGDKDIYEGIPEPIAKLIIENRNETILAIFELIQAFEEASPEAFRKYWYYEALARSIRGETNDPSK